VKLLTKSLGNRFISKREIIPVVFLVESLTKAISGNTFSSIVNTLEQDIILDPPQFPLDAVENKEAMTLIHSCSSRGHRPVI
jgi:hypothetical protein